MFIRLIVMMVMMVMMVLVVLVVLSSAVSFLFGWLSGCGCVSFDHHPFP